MTEPLNKPVLPFVEVMLTQACNLSCKGCTNYSDLVHKGYLPWHQGRSWIKNWLHVIDIPDFGIMGGEPLINPEYIQWLYGVRELLPNSQIRFTTNGLLLHKHWEIFDVIKEIGNVVFKISAHVSDVKLENTISEIFKLFDWEPVTEFGIDRWKTDNDIRFQVNRPEQFIKTYKNNYTNMHPWQSKPADAFSNCVQQTCPLLHNERIYKCSTSGLLLETLSRFNYPNWEQWEKYMSSGIHWESDIEDINKFINNFGKPSAICGQCPSKKNIESVVNHKIHVYNRKIK